jgi:hypothetical protein
MVAATSPVYLSGIPAIRCPMNEFLRDRILRKLEGLSDERLYQVLDYVEFIESKYAERQDTASNPLFKFAEAVEDKLRAGRVSASAISETMNLMNKAVGVLNGVAAAGKSVAEDFMTATAPPRQGGTGAGAQSTGPTRTTGQSSGTESSQGSSTSSGTEPSARGGAE